MREVCFHVGFKKETYKEVLWVNKKSSQQTMDERELYNRLKSRCPVKQLNFDKDLSKYPSLHKELMDIKRYNTYYVRMVLKKILDTITPEDEWVYEEYLPLLQCQPPQAGDYEDVILYSIGSEVGIRLWEKPRLISSLSTTGFRTWEAAIYLCLYLYRMGPMNLYKQCILELGAGTGLVSIFLYKWLKGNCKIYITDGDSNLLESSLLRNLSLNGISNLSNNNDNDSNDSNKIIRQRLVWDEDKNIPKDVTLLVGADITYDSTSFVALCRCIKSCLRLKSCQEMLISCTIRSKETINQFLEECNRNGLNITCVSENDTSIIQDMENLLYRKLIAPTHIYRIT